MIAKISFEIVSNIIRPIEWMLYKLLDILILIKNDYQFIYYYILEIMNFFSFGKSKSKQKDEKHPNMINVYLKQNFNSVFKIQPKQGMTV